jgi:hypothetical protein
MTTYTLRYAVQFNSPTLGTYIESGTELRAALEQMKDPEAEEFFFSIFRQDEEGYEYIVADFNRKSDALRVLDELNKGQTT